MNLLKSFKIIVCLLLIGSMLSGCMSSTHLKDLSVVEGMGIDSNGKETKVTVQTLNVIKTAGSESTEGNMTVNTEAGGETIVDAVSSLTNDLTRKLFFGQNKLIVLSKDIAENDFKTKLDYFLRSDDTRNDIAVCISDSSAKDIIESKENDSKVPCENILYLLKNNEETGTSAYVTTGELLKFYSDKTTDIFLPVLKKNKDSDNVKTAGIGIFSGDKLSYVLDEKETTGFLFISGRVKNCVLEFDSEDYGKIGVKISNIKTQNRAEVKDGNILFITEVKAKLIIDEIEKGLAVSLTKDDLFEINSLAENEIISLCEKAFKACSENNSDCMRVGDYLAKCEPDVYDSVCDKWDDYFQSVKYSASADCKLKKISDNTQLE